MNTSEYWVMRRLAPLMPINDPLEKERPQIEALEYHKIITFITQRPISREVAFFYLLSHKMVDFTKVFTAEEIKDIYMNNHPEYKSIYEIVSPNLLILLGKEVYNKLMISILNLLVDSFTRNPTSKTFMFGFTGLSKDFKEKYMNAQERGVLTTGKVILLTSKKVSTKSNPFEF